MDEGPLQVVTVATAPYPDQRPGPGGLRRRVAVFQGRRHYLHTYLQSVFSSMDLRDRQGCTLVVGGDGRFFNRPAMEVLVQMAAANGVGRLIVGCHGIMSTPAVSCAVRKYKAMGGIVLTASSHPGGPHGDFGVKFNSANGGTVTGEQEAGLARGQEVVTNKIFQISRTLEEFTICPGLRVDLGTLGRQEFDLENKFKPFTGKGNWVEKKYTCLPRRAAILSRRTNIFDFAALKELLSGQHRIRIRVDAMSG
ncbi:hypothetical protein CRUP_027257, partial [Coryphaenoides rupestris]